MNELKQCCVTFGKYFLYLFNFIFWIIGIILIWIGVWIISSETNSNFMTLMEENGNKTQCLRAVPTIFIIVGLIVLITGVVGCYGTIKEHSSILTLYAVIVAMILILQIAAGITAVVFRDSITNELKKSMYKTVYRSLEKENDALKKSFDFLQRHFDCCGVEGPTDWFGSSLSNETNNIVPASCCKLDEEVLLAERANLINLKKCTTFDKDVDLLFASNYIHTNGCYDCLLNWINEHAASLIGAAFGLTIFQAAVIMMACNFKNLLQRYEYV